MHQRERRFDPRLVDGLVVAAVAVPGLLGLAVLVALPEVAIRDIPLPAVPLLAVQAGALWWRRRHPLAVFATTVGALLLAQALGDVNATSFLGPYAAAYALGAYGSRQQAFAGLIGVGVAALVNVAVVALVPDATSFGPILIGPTGVLIAAAGGIGRYVRVRREYLDTLIAYAHQLEKDRDEQARRAVLEERRRIARELHDQVAHYLGVAALQAGAARTWLDRDHDRAGTALASAEQAVRTALTTMPVILEALRTDDSPVDRAPQPTLRDIDELLARVSQAGLSVDLRICGERRPLAPAVEVAAYRIVQEALTNVMKHAGDARSTVELRYDSDRLVIEVRDTGNGATATRGEGARVGLIGMRERVDLLGGELVTTSRDGGGFEVRATLPTTVEEEGTR